MKKNVFLLSLLLSIGLITSIASADQIYMRDLPPDAEGVICESEDYAFCYRTEAGFDNKIEYFGIYNYKNEEIDMEFQEIPSTSIDTLTSEAFHNCSYLGNGVFECKTDETHQRLFVSAKAGTYFFVENIPTSRFSFYCDKAPLIIDDLDYYIGPYYLGTLDVYGNLEVICEAFPHGNLGELGDIKHLSPYGFLVECKDVLHYYSYENNDFIDIKDVYVERYKASDNPIFVMTDDGLAILNLLGQDGEMYYAFWDKKGNVTTSATKMSDCINEVDYSELFGQNFENVRMYIMPIFFSDDYIESIVSRLSQVFGLPCEIAEGETHDSLYDYRYTEYDVTFKDSEDRSITFHITDYSNPNYPDEWSWDM